MTLALVLIVIIILSFCIVASGLGLSILDHGRNRQSGALVSYTSQEIAQDGGMDSLRYPEVQY